MLMLELRVKSGISEFKIWLSLRTFWARMPSIAFKFFFCLFLLNIGQWTWGVPMLWLIEFGRKPLEVFILKDL